MTEAREDAAWCVPSLAVAPWHLLLPVRATASVLDLGAGAATTAPALALAYRRLIAVVPDAASATSLRADFRRRGVTGARAVVGTPLELPVRARSMDVVALGDTLGRVGRDAQVRLLRTVHDALKPGGWVVLGVDNRHAMRLEAWRDPSLRSARGYRRLLETAGYRDVRVWCAIPDHAEPRYLVPCRQRAFSHFVRRLDTAPRGPLRAAVRETLHRLGLLRYVVDSYCIAARSGRTDG